MQIEKYRSDLSAKLAKSFKVDQVKATIVPPSQLNGPLLKSMTVYCYEFIINKCERYFTFAIELDNQVYFTRAKEGIREYLTPLIRQKDFSLLLTPDNYNPRDVVGKFIEGKINQLSREVMEQCLWTAFPDADDDFSFSFGFKVLRHHKEALSFDSEVELLVKRNGSVEYETYRGQFIDSRMGKFKNKYGEEVSMKEIARR